LVDRRVFLLIILFISPVYIVFGQDYTPNTLTVDVFIDGSVNIDYSVEPDPMLPRINVTLPGKNYANVLAVDEDGIIMDWDQNNGGIEVDSIGAEELSISYSSTVLTNKTGSMWTVSIDSPASTVFILPLDAVLVGLSSTPSGISIINNRAAITMSQGSNRISYMLGTTGTKEHSMVLLSQAETKIYEANQLGIIIIEAEALFTQATEAYGSGSYIISEQLSQESIQKVDNIIELANQAEAQIKVTEELLAVKTSSVNQETIDSVNIILGEAKIDYEDGKYTSANTKALEAYTLIQNAEPIIKSNQNYLIIVFGLVLAGGIALLYMKNIGGLKKPEFDNLVEVDLEKILMEKKYLRTSDKEVLKFINETNGAFMTEIRERFDMPKSSAWRMAKRLEEEGVILATQIGRETYLQLRNPEAVN
jgi:uncharacterized membrane protein